MSRGGLDRFAPCEFNLQGQRHGATESTDLEFHVSIAKAYQGLMKFEENDPIICVLWRLFGLSATIYDSGYVHISQHPRSSDVFQSCLTLAFIIYVGWWILQDSSKPRFKGSCPSMRSFCHGRTLSDGYICNGMGVSENGACMGMPVYRKKKHVEKMDDPWWSIKFRDAQFSDPNLECWAIQQNFAGDSNSQSCARCIEFGHRRVQGSKWKDTVGRVIQGCLW